MSPKALVWCCIALLLAMPVRLFGQESIAAARQLYAAAEYHNALAMLGGLLATNPSPQDRQSIELYRIFCLFALNAADEANSALEALIVRDPLFRPSAEVVPRRLRPAFSDARKRLLPAIIQEKYVVAKAAFDQGDYRAATAGFTQTLMALSDPDIAAEAEQRPLSDLRVLAKGFNELAVRALAPPATTTAPAKPETDAPATAPARTAATGATAAATTPRPPRIYQVGDAGVTMPVIVRQDMPAFPNKVISQKVGQLELVINENGAVESATIVAPLDPWYNALVLAAAKSWKYRPATVDGVPVKFRKRIQMKLSPDR